MKTRIIGFTALYLLSLNSVTAQVESKAYGLMLQGLLSHTVNEVSVNEIDSIDNILFLDARKQQEYQISHIKNAIWIGYDSFNKKRIAHIPKDQKIIVYCSVGYRSEKIAEKLVKKGYQEVSNLYGGIFEWVNQGKPVYKNGETTDKVDAYDKIWGIWLRKGEKVYE